MVSPLEAQIKKQVASAFKGRLLKGVIRRVGTSSINEYGDLVPGAATTFLFEGIRDTFTLEFAQAAGVLVTDAKILVLLGSVQPVTELVPDDQIRLRSEWFQLRKKVEADPAGATQAWAGFEIEDPT